MLRITNISSKVSPIDVDRYLKRLGVKKEGHALDLIKKLHKAHLMKIPYENLDIFFNRPIILDIHKIYHKIINQKRGGIAFESNLLFFHLLRCLGFECSLGSAQSFHHGAWNVASNSPIIFLQLKEEIWILDIAHTTLFIEPKKLVVNKVQLDYNKYFRFIQDPDSWYILQSSVDNILFKTEYRFELRSYNMIEFLDACNSYQESQKSGKLVSQLFPSGRITLTERKLLSYINGTPEETPVLQEDDFATKLQNIFGIDYNQLILQRFNQ